MSGTVRSFLAAGWIAMSTPLLFVGALAAKAEDPAPSAPASATTPPAAQSPGEAADKAPFGLSWGATKAEIEKLGVTLTPTSDQANGERYVATNLPMVIADVDGVALDLGFGGKLYRISAISRTYQNDPYGSSVRGRYDEILTLLREKYGPGKQTEHTDKFYGGNNWAFGLMQNENWLYSNFDAGPVSIEISCRSQRLASTYWVLIYENNEGAAAESIAKAKHEKGAL